MDSLSRARSDLPPTISETAKEEWGGGGGGGGDIASYLNTVIAFCGPRLL